MLNYCVLYLGHLQFFLNACPRIIKPLLFLSRKRKRIYKYTHSHMHPKGSRECLVGLALLNQRENKADTAFTPLLPFFSGRKEKILKQLYTFNKAWGVPYRKARQSDLRYSSNVSQWLLYFMDAPQALPDTTVA